MSNKKVETDPRQQIQSPENGASKSTNSIVPNNHGDVKVIVELQDKRRIPTADIVEVVALAYPKFDRFLLSKVKHGDETGVRLIADARRKLLKHFDVDIHSRRKPNRKKPNRVQARLPDTLYEQMLRHLQQTGKTTQDFLEGLISQFFKLHDGQKE